MRRLLAIAVAALVGACLLVGCGSSKKAATSACVTVHDTKVVLDAKNIQWDVTCLRFAPGQVAFTIKNDDQVAHNLHVIGQGVDVKTPLVAGPTVQHLTVDLSKKGTYQFVCDLHSQMEGTIIVG